MLGQKMNKLLMEGRYPEALGAVFSGPPSHKYPVDHYRTLQENTKTAYGFMILSSLAGIYSMLSISFFQVKDPRLDAAVLLLMATTLLGLSVYLSWFSAPKARGVIRRFENHLTEVLDILRLAGERPVHRLEAKELRERGHQIMVQWALRALRMNDESDETGKKLIAAEMKRVYDTLLEYLVVPAGGYERYFDIAKEILPVAKETPPSE